MTPQSLSTLLTRARRAIALNFPAPLWVRCELAEVSERRGHRYLQLIEKGDGEATVARVQGVVWARTFRSVLRKRGPSASEVLTAGQEVVLQAEVDLHEVYGLKLVVVDWDPEFTLGQLELRRREIVRDLQARRLLRQNASLALPPVLQRLAVLSSAQAAGYADFMAQLKTNPYGYRLSTHLFDVSVQGERVEDTIRAALSQVAENRADFDAVVVLRGGGSRVDLASFDRLGVGEAIASCPLPVLCGIGHETDETLPDLGAHTSLKTPTALADFVIERAAGFEAGMLSTAREVARLAERRRARLANHLATEQIGLSTRVTRGLERRRGSLTEADRRLRLSSSVSLRRCQERLDAMGERLAALDPRAVLARGFAVVTREGATVRRAAMLSAGERILTHFEDGPVASEVVRTDSP